MTRLFRLCAVAACLCAMLAVVSAAPALFDPKVVPLLDSAAFRAQIALPQTVTLVAFHTARNGKSKELAPQYSSLAKSLTATGGITVAAVDCKAASDICAEQDVSDESLPVVRLFAPNSKVHSYKSKELKTKPMTDWVWSVYPNLVQLLTAKSKARDTTKARVLLFTEKRETSGLYKSIALALSGPADKDRVVVAEVRKTEKALLNEFGIGKTFPVLMVEPAVVAGEEPKSARRYDGKMERSAILAFIASHMPGAAAGHGDAAATAGSTDAAAAIPQLSDQSCLAKHCSGPLCIVMFASAAAPDFASNLQALSAMDTAARADKATGKFKLVWVDTTPGDDAASKARLDWAAANFDVQPQPYPQLLLLSVRKERFAPYIGSFSTAGVLDFMRDVTKGRTKTVPFYTADKKLTSLPTDTQLCPPEAPKAEPKPASKPTAAPVNEDGELYPLTAANYAESFVASAKPWTILFHSPAAAAAAYANVSTSFERVARNMKDMVLFGTVDVDAEPSVAASFGIELPLANGAPLIRNVPHGLKAKSNPASSSISYTEDLSAVGSDPKTLRAFALTLLAPAKVMTLTSTSMQQFMGDIKPNTPFGPKLVLFAKPAEDGKVAVPDMMKALALEFTAGSAAAGKDGIVFAVASSRERDLARQFNVTRIPMVYTMHQSPDIPGQTQPGQIAVTASPYDGALTYPSLQRFCEALLRNYENQKADWVMRAQRQPPPQKQQQQQQQAGKGKGKPNSRSYKPPQPAAEEEDERVDLDSQGHDEL